jgi:2-succinyl-5-enolpyruvyl-6-hydroxy-3-cyclohexene-1-carboxylate synthase
MVHPKQHITDLAEICHQQGVHTIIVSPGSRNAPLIQAFYQRFGNRCISIVDERSAAYFGLGISRSVQKPVVLLCTSGTAVLNYAPALSEAFYQQVPLISITADRPAEWIDQYDNQTINQKNIYRNFIKYSYQFPQEISCPDDLWFAHRIANELFYKALHQTAGPVHLNVPLREPLYDKLPEVSAELKCIKIPILANHLQLPDNLVIQWKEACKILIVHGQDVPESGVSEQLNILTSDKRVVVVAENISNLQVKKRFESLDIILAHNPENESIQPDLLIVSGNQVVSKKLKKFLRGINYMNCWRIGANDSIIDTYQKTSVVLPHKASDIYKALTGHLNSTIDPGYQQKWGMMKSIASSKISAILNETPFCDLTAFNTILQTVPENSILELGNSSVIRYSQIFDSRVDIVYYSNRGVSGIDGCLSAAAGTASAASRLTIAIVGDLSFVYDSNALWNRALPSNFRIIVINNKGGGIFKLIEGPSDQPGFEMFINAYHPVEIKKLAEAFHLNYFCADNLNDLEKNLPSFYDENSGASVFEIYTNEELNTKSFYKVLGKGGSQKPEDRRKNQKDFRNNNIE